MPPNLAVDGNTRALWRLDGTVASAAKKDNAEGDATWDLNETGTLAADTGFEGLANGCYLCNATGGMYTSTNFTDYNVAAITIELWMKNPSGTTGYQFMFVVNDGGVETMAFYKSGTTWYFNLDVGGSSRQHSVAQAVLDDGLWHYIALTYDGANVKLYIDGVQYGSSIAATGNIRTGNPAPLGIGTWGTSPTAYRFKGYLDEVRVSDIARSAATILANYVGGSSLHGIERTPIRGVMRGTMRP